VENNEKNPLQKKKKKETTKTNWGRAGIQERKGPNKPSVRCVPGNQTGGKKKA